MKKLDDDAYLKPKYCPACKHTRPADEFYKIRGKRVRLHGYCKECMKSRQSEYRRKNAERVKVTLHNYYVKNKEKLSELAREYRIRTGINKGPKPKKTTEEKKERRERYYSRNRKRILEYQRQWRRKNKNRRYEYGARRQAWKKTGIKGERIYREVVYERDNAICYLCGKHIDFVDLHVDHVFPLSKGGTHTYDNVKATHKRCNLKKKDKLMVSLQ